MSEPTAIRSRAIGIANGPIATASEQRLTVVRPTGIVNKRIATVSRPIETESKATAIASRLRATGNGHSESGSFETTNGVLNGVGDLASVPEEHSHEWLCHSGGTGISCVCSGKASGTF